MKVILESPYAGDLERNLAYARAALRDSLNRGEAPFASHLLYTQALDDTVPEQRRQGLRAAQQWYYGAAKVVVYQDYGISPGMQLGIDLALAIGLAVEYRRILP